MFEDCEDGHGPTERSSEVAGRSDEGLGSSAASPSDQGMELDSAIVPSIPVITIESDTDQGLDYVNHGSPLLFT